MQDRVADVLAQRAALDRGGLGGVALSILLHGSITGLAVYAALHQPAAMPVSTLKIRFAQPARTAMPAAAPLVQKPKPAEPRIEPPKPVPLEPPKPAAKAPDKDTVPLSPFGKSTKKGSENAPVPKVAAPAPPATASADEVGVGQTGVTGLEGGDFPYTLYIDRMTTLIGSHWARTQIAGGAKTVVYFEIERDGKIRAAKTEISSGSGLFDRSALGAVLASSPLPPLPFGYSGTYLGVHLTFR